MKLFYIIYKYLYRPIIGIQIDTLTDYIHNSIKYTEFIKKHNKLINELDIFNIIKSNLLNYLYDFRIHICSMINKNRFVNFGIICNIIIIAERGYSFLFTNRKRRNYGLLLDIDNVFSISYCKLSIDNSNRCRYKIIKQTKYDNFNDLLNNCINNLFDFYI